MRWWIALVLTAPLFAADWPVRDLARKIAASAGSEVAIEVTGPDAAIIRTELTRELRTSPGAAVTVVVASGQSWTQDILSAEIRKGEERAYVTAAAPRLASQPNTPGVVLERTLLHTQPVRMLDAIESPGGLYILEPDRIAGPDGERTAVLPPSRDPRARLALGPGGPVIEPAASRDEAVLPNPCGGELRLSTLDSSLDEEDAVTGAGAPVAFNGPVLALHAHGGVATAIVRELSTGLYAAYRIAPLCRR